MANVFDVAAYILKSYDRSANGPLTGMKLQKLVYYSQAWSLVWDEKPIFAEKIQAWANGPVVRELYNLHAGSFEVTSLLTGDATALSKDESETVDAVLKHYGSRTAQALSDLTHQEAPWRAARESAGLKDGDRGTVEITHGALHEYYGSL